jgi:hypothetical protein
METLSNILASFDISQILLSAFPQIFTPVLHALQGMFVMLSEIAEKQFTAHPGLISGTIIFLLGYLSWTGISKLRRSFLSARSVNIKRSR